MKRIIKKFSIGLALMSAMIIAISNTGVSAKVSVKDLLKSGVKQMEEATSIGFSSSFSSTYVDDESQKEYYYNTSAVGVSDDLNALANIFGDNNSRLEYIIGDTVYTKFETITNEWTKSPATEGTHKFLIQKNLNTASKIKLKSTSSKTYTVFCDLKSDEYKNATVVISKKTGNILSVKFTLKKRQCNYYGSKATFTYISGKAAYNNITYGETKIAIPDELAK